MKYYVYLNHGFKLEVDGSCKRRNSNINSRILGNVRVKGKEGGAITWLWCHPGLVVIYPPPALLLEESQHADFTCC